MTDVSAAARNYRAIGDVPLEVIRKELARVKSPMLASVEATHAAASGHSALFWAQAWLENQWRLTGILIKPDDYNPVGLRPEVQGQLGPFASGIIQAPDGGQFLRFKTDALAVMEWRRRLFDDPTYKGGVYARTTTLEQMLSVYAPSGDKHPVTGLDNADVKYMESVITMLKRFAALEAQLEPAPDEGNDMPQYPVDWPGVPGGPVIFSFPVKLDYLVPEWRTNNRPGIKARRPRKPVQHENGNPAAYAAQDSRYLFQGAEGRTASWHATVDHMEAYVNLPADELGWHASDGSGPGNYQGFAVELSQRSLKQGGSIKALARDHAAEVMGRIAVARLGGDRPAKMHRDYAPDRKKCPQYFIDEPAAWNHYVDRVNYYADDELARMGKPVPTPTPLPTGWAAGDRFRTIADRVNVRQGWGTASRLVGTLDKGTTGVVGKDGDGRFTIEANGYTWLNVAIDGFGTGWMAIGPASDRWIEKIAAPAPKPTPKPEPKPVYAKALPVKELLGTDLKKHDTAVGIVTANETEFIFVADVIQFTAPSRALQYAGAKAPSIRADYQKAERAIAAWLVKAADGEWYYMLTGGDDEWARVRYTDTVRVSDAPLIDDGSHV